MQYKVDSHTFLLCISIVNNLKSIINSFKKCTFKYNVFSCIYLTFSYGKHYMCTFICECPIILTFVISFVL